MIFKFQQNNYLTDSISKDNIKIKTFNKDYPQKMNITATASFVSLRSLREL